MLLYLFRAYGVFFACLCPDLFFQTLVAFIAQQFFGKNGFNIYPWIGSTMVYMALAGTRRAQVMSLKSHNGGLYFFVYTQTEFIPYLFHFNTNTPPSRFEFFLFLFLSRF